ncbi:S9 family peptidase [Streptomyces armeniacus]|uniref:S9 family peptidase n=1 Tax=Streptomyces armeniacus TaxID=83291 RepID=A0A345XJ50_9ACTN|nr:prolyl oligopeptidase family serine peptidase [Streptomyces armeniacus]AXK31666.1 S9 family peptidase [Streptomyces armeniacus]
MTQDWSRFFEARQCVSARRGRGRTDDLVLMVHDEPDGSTLTVWNAAEGAGRRVLGEYGDPRNAVLTADGRAVLNLLDDNGSEVGHVWSLPVDGSPATDLTPGLTPFTLRGIDVAREGTYAVLTAVTADGFALWLIGTGDERRPPRRLFSSQAEAWNGLISADGRWACLDTTDHNPGIRRFAVTVVPAGGDTPDGPEQGAPEGGTAPRTLSDGPAEPVRGIRFSPVAGDDRILVATERTGFIRPCLWHFPDGSRTDLDASHLHGDLVPLDWSDDARYVLLVHVDRGVHHVMEWNVRTGALDPLVHPSGAFFEADIADAHPNYWASHYGADGQPRLLHQRFDLPLSMLRADRAAHTVTPVWTPALVHPGTPLTSHTVTSLDGTTVQLWAGRPRGTREPLPTLLSVHGGPQLVTVDRYTPEAQAWLENGFAYAAVNYRGSQTFGRRYREGFWHTIGERELEDLAASVEWLVAEGIADKDKVFVSGASYGGYLSLLSVGRLPGLFAGAMAFVPMADWAGAYDDMNPALRAAWRSFFRITPDEDPGVFRRASPISYVEHVRAPVWIKTGTHDTRTPPRQVHRYAEALENAGGDVTLEWFSGGHETTSRNAELADQRRIMELAARALRGERWADGAVTPPPPGSVGTGPGGG